MITHGLSKTTEYQIWCGMIKRCCNPKCPAFPRYGGRGIDVCPQWRESFEVFLADVGRRPSREFSIDRIDNDKGYWPDNVRWATQQEQALNRRDRRVHFNCDFCGVQLARSLSTYNNNKKHFCGHACQAKFLHQEGISNFGGRFHRSYAYNVKDRDELKPEAKSSGERNGAAKITKEIVLEIRKLHKEGWLQIRLAEKFNLCRPHVSDIVNYKRWAHV